MNTLSFVFFRNSQRTSANVLNAVDKNKKEITIRRCQGRDGGEFQCQYFYRAAQIAKVESLEKVQR